MIFLNSLNKQILFIINKFAGHGFDPKVEGKIIDQCANHGYECTIEFTQGKGHATLLAKEGIEKQFLKIIAVGGDGTVNEVAQAMIHQNIPMGIIPKGSGNGLSRHLGIPLHYSRALENALTGKTVSVDTFLVNNRLSLNVSGVGFDGHIANMFGKDGKRGLSGYAKLILKEFFSFHPFTLTISSTGTESKHRVFITAFANSSQYGNNAKIAPLASVQDGKLDVMLIEKISPWQSISFLQKMLSGNIHQSSLCEYYSVNELVCHTSKEMPYHIDGEASGYAQQFEIKVLPASLKLIIPATVQVI